MTFVTIQCIQCVHCFIFAGVLGMNVWKYSMKMFREIPLSQAKRISLSVFLSVLMVLCSKISLMEDGHVDIGQKIHPSS